MSNETFQKLKYGNVIANEKGEEFIVMHTLRDEKGNATHVGILPALNMARAGEFQVVSNAHSETYLGGRTVQG